MTEQRHLEYRPTDSLKLWDENPRDNDKAVPEVAESIKRYGFLVPVVVNGEGMVMAGNTRLKAALRLGLREVPVILADHLTADELREFALVDNKTSELATWSLPGLAAVLKTLTPASQVRLPGFTADELKQLAARATPPAEDPAEDTEPPPPVMGKQAKATTQPGEVFRLGSHVLVCADSLTDDALDHVLEGDGPAMVLTDPPFAIYGSSTGVSSNVADDKMVRPFFRQLFLRIYNLLPPFGHAYVHCDWRSWATLWDGARSANMSAKNLLVWDKQSGGLGNNYANTYELVGFFAKQPHGQTMKSFEVSGQRPVHRPNILRYPRVRGADREHNAAKPVEMLQELVKNSSDPGQRVLDLFGGSGSTLIACEKAGRRCVTVEIEPAWCDVIIARWERLTGQKAERVTP
jgi:hypothetical protein